MPYDVLRFAEVAANPIGTIQIPSDHNAVFVDYPYDAAGRKAIYPQRVLKAFKLGAHGEDALQSPLLIFYRITNSDNECPLRRARTTSPIEKRSPASIFW